MEGEATSLFVALTAHNDSAQGIRKGELRPPFSLGLGLVLKLGRKLYRVYTLSNVTEKRLLLVRQPPCFAGFLIGNKPVGVLNVTDNHRP